MHKLAETIKAAYPFYKNPILSMSNESSLGYLRERMSGIDLSAVLSTRG